MSALDVRVVQYVAALSLEMCVCAENTRLGETNLAHFERSVVYSNLMIFQKNYL